MLRLACEFAGCRGLESFTRASALSLHVYEPWVGGTGLRPLLPTKFDAPQG